MNKPDNISMVELKYFEKYKNLVDSRRIALLLEKYKAGPTVFKPIRKKFSKKEQEELFELVDKSDNLSSQEKIETIIGLMMILDGIFPEEPILVNLEKVFGKEFIEIIMQKKYEFKKGSLVKKLIKFVKEYININNKNI